ncbi:MAG: PhzF family phenazine biosynthesis protein [Nostocoides sp.]
MRITVADVFGSVPFTGNGLAVIHDAEQLTSEQMQAIAAWTNLSETTFLLPPTQPGVDYRVRIFTTGSELPFAGHPTLGSAHAWLAAGGAPASDGGVIQECAAGLVPVRIEAGLLAFAAPSLVRTGPVDASTRDRVLGALGLSEHGAVDMAWCDNGPGWIGVRVATAQQVLELVVDRSAFDHLAVGVIGPYATGEHPQGSDVEVRAFYDDGAGFDEDPVTGSLNAALAQWLVPAGVLPAHYVASQGRVLGRDGRVRVDHIDGQIWVGGTVRTIVSGDLPHVDGLA